MESVHVINGNCILCTGKRASFVLERRRLRAPGKLLRLVRCSDCGVVYQENWLPEFDAELYDYYQTRIGRDWAQIHNVKLAKARYQALLHKFAGHTNGRTLLDVGCGDGHFVHVAQSLGWCAAGIDASESAIAVGLRQGAPVQVKDVFSDQLPTGAYSVITLLEVIEHVSEPLRFLRRLADLTIPGGVVYLTTPNFDSFDRRVLGPAWTAIHEEHLSYFAPSTLQTLIQKIPSLEITELRTQNLSLASIRALGAKFPLGRAVAECPVQIQPESAAPTKPDTGKQDQWLRNVLEGSVWLRLGKRSINEALYRTGLGNTITLLCRRRSRDLT